MTKSSLRRWRSPSPSRDAAAVTSTASAGREACFWQDSWTISVRSRSCGARASPWPFRPDRSRPRCLPREVSRNLWSQAEFDSVTARKLCELRERFYPDTVQFPPERMAVVLTDLYARGATIVSSEKGYGIYFRREDTLYFVELMAEDDRSAEVLMEAAREKEVIVERAVITVGAAQNLFLGEGTRQDYGMIRFDAEPFDVEESYMRLMMES